MIGVLLALQIVSGESPVTIVYDDLPKEVVRLELFEWNGDRPGPLKTAVSGSRRIAVRGRSRRQYVAALVRADAAYLIDGPFVWPDADAARLVERRWRRTVSGPLPPAAQGSGAAEWISPDALSGPWPRCFHDATHWSCWGVVSDSHGAVVLRVAGSMWWTTTKKTTEVWRAEWGRLIVVSDAMAMAGLRVEIAYPVAPPPGRLRGMRLETRSVAGARAAAIAPNAIWIAGDALPPDAWVAVASENGGPQYFSLSDVAGAPAALPLHVSLRPRDPVDGRTLSADGLTAPGTLVTVFRLIDPVPREPGRDPPRRVLAEEVTADEEGRFRLATLGEAEYEVVAWHSQLGRASVALPPGASEMVIRLRSSGIARGRVLAGGRPVEGVEVISVPDAAMFGAAQDITDIKGGDARSGPDGRFSVAMAVSGGGELRIGGGKYAVTRVALPKPAVPLFDAGDVILADPIRVTVVLDRDPGCEVRAAGPAGRTGLQMVPGRRVAIREHAFALPEAGLWAFTLVCPGEKRLLSPGVVHVGAADTGSEVRLAVR
jgi:hypothetical protein